MFSRSSLVDVHLAYKIKNVVSKCSGVPSSVLANTLPYIQLFIGKYADLFTRKGATQN